MGNTLTGDQYKVAVKRLGEVLRQLGQTEYPYDPERLNAALQAITEGRFETVGAVGGLFPCQIHAADLIPKGWTIIEDVFPTELKVKDMEFISFLEKGEEYVGGEKMRQRAITLRGNLGLCDAKRVLADQAKLPKNLRGNYIIFPGTFLRDSDDDPGVPYLRWRGVCWVLDFSWLCGGFRGSDRLARGK